MLVVSGKDQGCLWIHKYTKDIDYGVANGDLAKNYEEILKRIKD